MRGWGVIRNPFVHTQVFVYRTAREWEEVPRETVLVMQLQIYESDIHRLYDVDDSSVDNCEVVVVYLLDTDNLR